MNMSENYYRVNNTNKDTVKFKLQLRAILLKLNENNLNIKNNDDNIKSNYDICIANKNSLIDTDRKNYATNNNITKINNAIENVNNNIAKINNDNENINDNITKINGDIENIEKRIKILLNIFILLKIYGFITLIYLMHILLLHQNLLFLCLNIL